MVKIANKFKNFTLFDWVLGAVILVGVTFFIFIFFRKQNFIIATVKVSEDNIVWPSPGTKDWFSAYFYEGMSEKDGIGKEQARVLNVFSYDIKPNRKNLYLTVRLRAVYTRALNQYSYKGRPILVGYPIKLQLDNVSVEGVVSDVEGSKIQKQKEKIFVEVVTWDDKVDPYTDTNFKDTTGIRPFIADALNKGDVIKDSNGEIAVKVIDKKVMDANKLTTNAGGKVLVQKNPLLKEMTLVLEVTATKIGSKYYLFDEIPILVGEKLPLNFSTVSVFPDITKISLNGK